MFLGSVYDLFKQLSSLFWLLLFSFELGSLSERVLSVFCILVSSEKGFLIL